jgi:hypothetical protein
MNTDTKPKDPGAPHAEVCGVPIYSDEAKAWNEATAAEITVVEERHRAERMALEDRHEAELVAVLNRNGGATP